MCVWVEWSIWRSWWDLTCGRLYIIVNGIDLLWVFLKIDEHGQTAINVVMNISYRWLSTRLQYLQCVSNGDTAVLHWTIDIYHLGLREQHISKRKTNKSKVVYNIYIAWLIEVKVIVLRVCSAPAFIVHLLKSPRLVIYCRVSHNTDQYSVILHKARQ